MLTLSYVLVFGFLVAVEVHRRHPVAGRLGLGIREPCARFGLCGSRVT